MSTVPTLSPDSLLQAPLERGIERDNFLFRGRETVR